MTSRFMQVESNSAELSRTAVYERRGMRIYGDDAKSLVKAGEVAGIFYDVTKQPVYVPGIGGEFVRVPDKNLLVRGPMMGDEQTAYFGVVGDNYKPINTRELFEALDTSVDGSRLADLWPIKTIGVADNGARIYFQMYIGQISLFDGKDPVDLYHTFWEGKDGSGGLGVKTTSVRIWCRNTLDFAIGQRNANLQHITFSHKEDAAQYVIWASQLIAKLNQAGPEAEKLLNSLANKKMSEKAFDMMLTKLFPEPRKNEAKHELASAHPDDKVLQDYVGSYEGKRNKVLEVRNLAKQLYVRIGDEFSYMGGTAYQAINAITESMDHYRVNPNKDSDTDLFGWRANYKAKALELVLAAK